MDKINKKNNQRTKNKEPIERFGKNCLLTVMDTNYFY